MEEWKTAGSDTIYVAATQRAPFFYLAQGV